MKVKINLVISDEIKNMMKDFSYIGTLKRTANVFMTASAGTIVKGGAQVAEHRSGERNAKIMRDLASGTASTTEPKKEDTRPRKRRRKMEAANVLAGLPARGDRTIAARNPVFLSDNEKKAITLKAGKTLGSSIDPLKNYYEVMDFLSERMCFYYKKHIGDGVMENGPVAALKPRYAKQKLKDYGPKPILVRSGQLIKAFAPKVK